MIPHAVERQILDGFHLEPLKKKLHCAATPRLQEDPPPSAFALEVIPVSGACRRCLRGPCAFAKTPLAGLCPEHLFAPLVFSGQLPVRPLLVGCDIRMFLTTSSLAAQVHTFVAISGATACPKVLCEAEGLSILIKWCTSHQLLRHWRLLQSLQPQSVLLGLLRRLIAVPLRARCRCRLRGFGWLR